MNAQSTLPLADLPPHALAQVHAQAAADYEGLRARGLSLDLTRGKPGPDQLDLSDALLRLPTRVKDASGVDTRNYGGLQGITELREIFAELLGVDLDQLVAGGNSSLTMMKDVLVMLLLHGGVDSERAWSREETIRIVCPVPGYDRHFALLESLGVQMVTVPMNDDGPDADAIAALVKDDPSIKGMWVVPTYANPSGSVTSIKVASRLVAMETAAPDFKIFWDNAYALHHLGEEEAKSADILSLAHAAGRPHRPIMFASTSKVTYAGAGVAFLAASTAQVAWYLGHLGMGSIGPDKVNQLRHAEFFGSAQGVRDLMVQHRRILAPKFAAVDAALRGRLDGLGVATWSSPQGGYFVNVEATDGTAGRVVQLAKDAGIALTPAGSSHPYKQDPDDRYIRLAPSFPSLDEVEAAMDGVAVCLLLAASEKLAAAHETTSTDDGARA